MNKRLSWFGGELVTAMIACIVAGIFVTAFIILWFSIAYRLLADKYREVTAAVEQIELHHTVFRQRRGSPDAEAAKRMLDTSRMIFRESLLEYNRIYTKPIYHLPGFLMGFRIRKEMDEG